jgi:hypothetical protein
LRASPSSSSSACKIRAAPLSPCFATSPHQEGPARAFEACPCAEPAGLCGLATRISAAIAE